MDEQDLIPAVRWAFDEGRFVLTRHAYVRIREEQLTTAEVRDAGAHGDLLEDYPERTEGHTMLLLGYARSRPVHVVTNVEAYETDSEEPLIVVTAYRPEPPEWLDDRTRGKKSTFGKKST